jgi:RimJ/RimL family protein N-acetyltransferase
MRPAQPVLSDANYVLRAPEVADSAQITQACQDRDIARFTQVPQPYTEADAVQFVAHASRCWADGTGAEFVVVDLQSALVGACGIVALDVEQSVAEIGYWVAPWARGQGVARAALQVITGWAHRELGLQRAYLRIEQVNPASQRVAAAAGFRVSAEALELEVRGERRVCLTYDHWAD